MSNQSNAIAQKASHRAQAPRVLYGLPCADCGAYYASNITECPVCQSGQRITLSGVPAAIPTATF
jgi:uncharacterized OB-fold protein